VASNSPENGWEGKLLHGMPPWSWILPAMFIGKKQGMQGIQHSDGFFRHA
jgi:hypothetical protein